MSQSPKVWHPKFIEYMNFIIKHPNYEGLPIIVGSDGPQWIATAKSPVGLARKKWAEAKAEQLGIPIEAGVYAKVMYAVHPTKQKVCQICGKAMSLQYLYPNANFARVLRESFGVEVDIYDDLSNVWDKVVAHGSDKDSFIRVLNDKFDTNFTGDDNKSDIIEACEALCRLGPKNHLGPGAMSNFPDRYDGFHSYNRCHRSSEDKGRSKENLKSYTKDRRAYEFWSDGNIMAANQFMGSALYFQGLSADHVGPISLGFVHDPRYLRPMSSSDNSSKRDRLTKAIIDQVLDIHKKTGVTPISWYSKVVWDYIATSYIHNEGEIETTYRLLLKQNMSNYMYVLNAILDLGDVGEAFLIQSLINSKSQDFQYTYEFDSSGNIVGQLPRTITARGDGEFQRFSRIAIQAVRDYNNKENRNLTQNLTDAEEAAVRELCACILTGELIDAHEKLKELMITIQQRLVALTAVKK